MDAGAIGRVFESLDPPLWVITAADGARRTGLLATFVTQGSIVPDCPRVLVGVARQHYTWELIESSGAFGLHRLSQDEIEWCWRFGMRSGRTFDKFAGLAHHTGRRGVPLLSDAPAWLVCRVESGFDTGDRTLYLGAVEDGGLSRDAEPLRVGTMFAHANEIQKTELAASYQADGAVDRDLISTWRRKLKERTGR
jgi:flavin reductase (DIM6/NTAB) family NADH-FMN oxidoreductase RutF